MARRSRVTGGTAIKRVLRKAPDEVANLVVDVLDEEGELYLRDQIGGAPVRSGRGRSFLKKKLNRKGLQVLIGLVGKVSQREAWYLFFIEKGTKDLRAEPFIRPVLLARGPGTIRRITAAVDKALRRVARGL